MSVKISKDEARILSAALWAVKYDWLNDAPTKEVAKARLAAFETLEKKLDEQGKDQRRTGRTSGLDDLSDVIKRFVNKHLNKK